MSNEADQEVLRRHIPSMVAPVVELVVNRLREALEASQKQDYTAILVAFGKAIELLDDTGVMITQLIPEDVRAELCNKVLDSLIGTGASAVGDNVVNETSDKPGIPEHVEVTDLPDELQEAVRAAFKETFGIDATIVGYSPPS